MSNGWKALKNWYGFLSACLTCFLAMKKCASLYDALVKPYQLGAIQKGHEFWKRGRVKGRCLFTYMHFWNIRISDSTYTEIQAFWLVEQQQQRLIFRNGLFWQGKIENVWAYNSKDIIAMFNFLAPFSAKIIA